MENTKTIPNPMLIKYFKVASYLLVAFIVVGALLYTSPTFQSLGWNFIFGLTTIYLMAMVSFIFADLLIFNW